MGQLLIGASGLDEETSGIFPWPDQQTKTLATAAAKTAADAWNSVGLGVNFAIEENPNKCAFVLVHGGRKDVLNENGRKTGKVVAEAFFHADTAPLFGFVCYDTLFRPPYSDQKWMEGTLKHEFGHILALRHEFALEDEKDDPVVIFGGRNQDSVMSYNNPMDIRKSDIADTLLLYLEEHTKIDTFDVLK